MCWVWRVFLRQDLTSPLNLQLTGLELAIYVVRGMGAEVQKPEEGAGIRELLIVGAGN